MIRSGFAFHLLCLVVGFAFLICRTRAQTGADKVRGVGSSHKWTQYRRHRWHRRRRRPRYGKWDDGTVTAQSSDCGRDQDAYLATFGEQLVNQKTQTSSNTEGNGFMYTWRGTSTTCDCVSSILLRSRRRHEQQPLGGLERCGYPSTDGTARAPARVLYSIVSCPGPVPCLVLWPGGGSLCLAHL